MRKFLTTAVGLGLAALLVAGGSPARAAGTEYKDPAGDATGLSATETSPRPSEPELDFTDVSYVSDGTNFTVSSKVQKLADPVASGGAAYRWSWNYDGIKYELVLQLPTPPTDTAFVRGGIFRGNGTTIETNCCKTKYDAKTNTVAVTLSLTSIAKGVKTTSPDSPKFGPGSSIEIVEAISQRSMGALLVSVDWARPAPGTKVTV